MNISGIKKILPKPLKKLFGRLDYMWNKWSAKLDAETTRDLIEYFNLDRKKIMHLARSGGELSADLWFSLNPKTEEEVRNFYKENPFYVFHLIFWHAAKKQKKFRAEIVKLAKGSVLDYGGGTGDISVALSKKGFDVDYADLPGRTFNFAKWLFQKKKCIVPMIDLSGGKICKKYGTIICIDVIEHVHDPKTLLKEFVNCLANEGQLIITGLHPVVDDGSPMHFEMGFNPEEHLESLGMEATDSLFLWTKRF